MNIERILKLADIVEKLPHGDEAPDECPSFDMSTWTSCGAPMCIAGWACHEFHPDGLTFDSLPFDTINVPNRAEDCLGLKHNVANKLFVPDFDDACFHDTKYYDLGLEAVTPQDAAAVLRHLADTGRVDWSILVA